MTKGHRVKHIGGGEQPGGGSIRTVMVGRPLDVLCWCERKVVRVNADAVRRGLTGSCGGAGCHGPAA